MSRTFHATSIYGENKELIERRKKRVVGKAVPSSDTWVPSSIGIASTEFMRVMKKNKDGEIPMRNLRQLEQETLDAYYSGTLPQDDNVTDHPIYSTYTQSKILAILNNHSMQVDLAIEKAQPEFPLLTYTPRPKEDLSVKELQNLMNKVWGIVYMLLPPKEIAEVQTYVLMYCDRITEQIQKTHMHINIALARNPDDDIL